MAQTLYISFMQTLKISLWLYRSSLSRIQDYEHATRLRSHFLCFGNDDLMEPFIELLLYYVAGVVHGLNVL